MWEQIPLPRIESWIRACSVPVNGDSLAIWTDDGVYQIRLQPSTEIVHLSAAFAERIFNSELGEFHSHGNHFRMHGQCGRHGWRSVPDLLSVHAHGFTAEIDRQRNRVKLVDAVGFVHQTIRSVDVNGPLLITHFSQDELFQLPSKYFVVCDSSALRVFKYRPSSEGVRPKWSVNASRESSRTFWNAIFENIDDDTPRLIYADWLEENGDVERAEFIRLQCRIAERESRGFMDPDDRDLAINRTLVRQHGDRWIGEMGMIKGIRFQTPFWRGFPTSVFHSVRLAIKATQEKAILAACPFDNIRLNCHREREAMGLENSDLILHWRNFTIHLDYQSQFDVYVRLFESRKLLFIRKISITGDCSYEMINLLMLTGPYEHLHTIECDTSYRFDNEFTFPVDGIRNCFPSLTNVIFNVRNNTRGLQDRKDIRNLASQVENVLVRDYWKPEVATRIQA